MFENKKSWTRLWHQVKRWNYTKSARVVVSRRISTGVKSVKSARPTFTHFSLRLIINAWVSYTITLPESKFNRLNADLSSVPTIEYVIRQYEGKNSASSHGHQSSGETSFPGGIILRWNARNSLAPGALRSDSMETGRVDAGSLYVYDTERWTHIHRRFKKKKETIGRVVGFERTEKE